MMSHYNPDNTVPELDAHGSNWVTYRDRMALMLASRNLADHLTSTEIPNSYAGIRAVDEEAATAHWNHDDAIAKQYIIDTLPDSIFHLIAREPNAKSIWDKLKANFENNGEWPRPESNWRRSYSVSDAGMTRTH
jgi:hypothetical protein